MVGELASRHALSKEVIDGVSERTGGVPLFVEEVTRLVLERGEQGGAQTIPPTLQQSLAARLDRLGKAREAAQIGAMLGREFAYSLLRDVAEMDEPALQAALQRLAEADILFVEGAGHEANYRFKHALVQDAAYDSLLKSRRQPLHRRAAEILRGDPERAAAEPELIAHHFTQAGLDDLAIEWWGKAGDQALRRSAFQEAIAHLGKAIAMADKAHDASLVAATTPGSTNQRLRLQTSYGRAMTLLRGFASEESRAAFTRARELAAQTDNGAERFAAYYGEWIGSIIRGETRMSRDAAAAFLREAEAEGRLTEIAAASRCLGLSCFALGDFLEARRCFDQALTDWDPDRDADARFRFIHDTEAAAKMSLALVVWHLGEIGRARQLMDEAVRRTLELGHAPTTASVNVYRGLLETARGDARAALNAGEILVRLGQEHGMALYLAVGELFSSWARAWLIDSEIGAIEYGNALKNYMDQGNKYFAPFNKGLLAELEVKTGDLQSASMSVDEGLALAQETEQQWSDVLLYRLSGEILLKQDATNSRPAEEAFRNALKIAQQQHARSFGLRAALSLAKLYQSTGRPAEAHAVLAAALGGFAPTPEMPEISEAQALMDRLA
jgi:tetratricopeptide (TPR) repeat protein